MKLIGSSNDGFNFQLGAREKDLLLSLLQLYPQIPSARQPLRDSASLLDNASSHELLDETLADHRANNRKQVQALLKDPKRLAKLESSWRLSLSTSEMEWLLQVLNDIRVGSWILLGSPEGRIDKVNVKNAPHLWAMEMAGSFQMCFLEMLEGGVGDK